MMIVHQRDKRLQDTRPFPSASDDAFERFLEQVRWDEAVLEVYDRRLAQADAIVNGRGDFYPMDMVKPQWFVMQAYLKQPWELHAEWHLVLDALIGEESGYSEAGYGTSSSSDSYGMSLNTGVYFGGNASSSDVEMNTGSDEAPGDSDDGTSTTSHFSVFSDELAENYIYGIPHRRDSLPYANDEQALFTTEVQDFWDEHCERRYDHLGHMEQWVFGKACQMSPIALNLDMYPALSREYMHIRESRLALRKRVPIADEGPVPNYCKCARNQFRSRRDRAEFERLSCDCLPPPPSEPVGTE